MIDNRFVLQHIHELPLLRHLPPEGLARVAAAFQILRYEPGEYVFTQGQPTQGMYLFTSGEGALVRQSGGGTERIGTVAGGQYLNETALYQGGIESASLQITQTAIVLFLSRAAAVTTVLEHPEIRRQLTPGAFDEPDALPKPLFKGQHLNEQVIRLLRRHWWAFGRHLWLPLLIVMLSFVVAIVLTPAIGGGAIIVGIIGLVIGAAMTGYLYFEWRDDAIIVTNERVIKMYSNLVSFTRSLNEIPLERILEIKTDIPARDPFARLFRYGTLDIKTAGDSVTTSLTVIPHPEAAQKMIFAERDRLRLAGTQAQKQNVLADVQRAIGQTPGSVASSGAIAGNAAYAQGIPLARTRYQDAKGDIVFRKHFTVWLQHIAVPGLFTAAGAGVVIGSILFPTVFAVPIGLLLGLIVLIVGGGWLYIADWDWRNDVFIIGEQQITIIRKRPLFLQNQVDVISLTQVDNVVSDVQGPINTLLNRGEVKIFPVGSERPKVLAPIRDPQSVHSELSRRIAAIKQKQQAQQNDQQRQVVLDYLAAFGQAIGVQDGQLPPPPAAPARREADPYPYGYPPPALTPSPSPSGRGEAGAPNAPAMPTMPRPPTAPPSLTPPAARGEQGAPFRDGVRPPRVPRIRPDDIGR